MPTFKPKRVALHEHLAAIVNVLQKNPPRSFRRAHPRGIPAHLYEMAAFNLVVWAIETQRMTAWARPEVTLGSIAAIAAGASPNDLMARDTSFMMSPKYWELVRLSDSKQLLVDTTTGRIEIERDQGGVSAWATCELDADDAEEGLASIVKELRADQRRAGTSSPQAASSQIAVIAALTLDGVVSILEPIWRKGGSAQTEAKDWENLKAHCDRHRLPYPSRDGVFRTARRLLADRLRVSLKPGRNVTARQITAPTKAGKRSK